MNLPTAKTFLLLLAGFCALPAAHAQTTASDLQAAFQHPPEAARPWVFWYWMNGAVTPEGITADLAAMKEAGIGGAYLMPIKGVENPPAITPPAEQLSPRWWAMVRYAMREADRLGLQLAMHVSDGFALAGGPWITPALSMQKLTSSTVAVAGGRKLSLQLPQPPTVQGYYRDVAVYAYPSSKGRLASTLTTKPQITSSFAGSNPQGLATPGNKESLKASEPGWVQYAFAQPFTCRSIRIRSGGYNYQAQRLRLSVSNDGRTFRPVVQLRPPRSGWQDSSAVTHSLPATTARFFRFGYDPAGSEPGAEDVDAAKWKQSLKVAEIRLSGEARLHQYEGKNGEVWRVSERTTAAQVPDSVCVPLGKIIPLTDKLDASGRLTWQAPPGRWTILRMGHTSTGTVNTTGGGGRGLECDKFNPAAVTLQFDNWFGEAVRQGGPELAARVLNICHVDSWECGSQNWSDNFATEFRARRGYDLLPWLPVLAGVPLQSADESERVLADVRQTIAELVNDKFYATLATLAHAKGCVLSAESVAPTMVSDGLLHYQHADVPMGEFWLRSPTHDKPSDMLDAISGAHIYGKNIVQAEAFTELKLSWDEHPAMLKTLQDRNYALGINRLVYHVFVHNPWLDRQPGMTLSGIGLFFQRDQTWWKPGRAWVDYARRCQALLQAGRPVVDVAVFTGEETPRRSVLPNRLINDLPGLLGPAAVAAEKNRLLNAGLPMRELPEKVSASANLETADLLTDPLHGYAYDSFNRDALLRLARVESGRIVLPGGASYGLLVVPGAQKMDPDSAAMTTEVAWKLNELVTAGATVVLNRKPNHSPSLKSFQEADRDILESALSMDVGMVGSASPPAKRGKLLSKPITAASLDALGLAPDLLATTSSQHARAVAWCHRTAPEFDTYFISNQLDSARTLDLSLRVAGRRPELWDAVTGEIRLATDWRVENGRTLLPVRLDRSGSVFVVFRQAATPPAATAPNWPAVQPVQTLVGPWQVRFDPKLRGPKKPVIFSNLTDWSKSPTDSVRYYSGTATYTQTFRWKPMKYQPRTYLDLGQVANLAEVRVNGRPCGTAWTAPYRLDITDALQKGDNQLEISVTNTWFNRLSGDQTLPPDQRRTWTPAPPPTAGKPLLPAGLLGPVTVGRLDFN